ncbi:MAG: NmrA family NAD(P)-binding protein [Xanthobacteraceae bacterium]|nr:NmrA family NAD(P)-binding protein [Xanthobacteraceae bacterium]
MIAVVGATGNTGRAVVKELKSLGQNPVAVVRNAEKAGEVLGADAKIAVADLNDKAALEKVLKGADSVFLTTAVNPQLGEQNTNAIDAALAAGVKYLVRLSAGRAVVGPDSLAPAGRTHYVIDQRLRGLKIGWVILRPGLFMQNVLGQVAAIKNDSKIVMPYKPDFRLALIDVRDTGAVAARILINPAPHAGKEYEFTGAMTSFGEFTDAFSEVLARKITYVGVTPEQAAEAMKARGMPDWLVAHALAIGRIGNVGGFSTENTKPIHDIVKRAPLTTKQFVTDFKGLFA